MIYLNSLLCCICSKTLKLFFFCLVVVELTLEGFTGVYTQNQLGVNCEWVVLFVHTVCFQLINIMYGTLQYVKWLYYISLKSPAFTVFMLKEIGR